MEHTQALQLYGATGVRYNVEAMARSDVQLMLDVKAGDDASFDFLLQKYRSPLVNFLFRMVRDTATAEDLAQEVFLRVYNARGSSILRARNSPPGCSGSRRIWR